MTHSSVVRTQALLEVIRQGLLVSSRTQSRNMLGNRSAYVGMSDVGKYMECPRACIASRLFAREDSLSRALTLQRGHWFEEGVGDALEALGLHVIPQLELSLMTGNVPLRAHLDFTLVWRTPRQAIRILEVKSMEHLPAHPYAGHHLQIAGQTSLLASCWNEPVFSMKDATGKPLSAQCSFPEICRRHFGMELSECSSDVNIEGWLLCLSMKDARAFGPFFPDRETEAQVFTCARQIWNSWKESQKENGLLASIPHASGFHLLCNTCEFSHGCPKFREEAFQPQWEPALAKLDRLREQRKELDSQIREIENALKQAYSQSASQGWIETGGHRFRLSISAGRRSLNRVMLADRLTEAFQAAGLCKSIDVDALLGECEPEGEPIQRLLTKTIKQ